MMETENIECFEISVYTENQVGLLSSIAGMFTRRSINIERLLVFPSRIQGIHQFKIRVKCEERKVREMVLQLEKKVDVIKTFYYVTEDRTANETLAVQEYLSEREESGNE